ncbi:hypothetical protein CYMTET_25516 [Cymbomonas tetramitiformis]|uniref:Uncharacterized protein n=1 Tax=Cymbomonas tetramitiformis TaxID=36881 RepID=A0AAE0KYZ3_9CHLO|nr:hypothetical protein CYMTET_25516 [Cymbomonas tetramitiformis]
MRQISTHRTWYSSSPSPQDLDPLMLPSSERRVVEKEKLGDEWIEVMGDDSQVMRQEYERSLDRNWAKFMDTEDGKMLVGTKKGALAQKQQAEKMAALTAHKSRGNSFGSNAARGWDIGA